MWQRQLVCLTIAPAFLTAAIYMSLARIIVVYGENISRLRPQIYTYTFICCDVISLILQAGGGAITATADDDQQDLSQTGVNIMIAGLVFQVASLAVFMAACGEYAFRVRRSRQWLNDSFADLRTTFKFKAFLVGRCSLLRTDQ